MKDLYACPYCRGRGQAEPSRPNADGEIITHLECSNCNRCWDVVLRPTAVFLYTKKRKFIDRKYPIEPPSKNNNS